MAAARNEAPPTRPKLPPAKTLEARENQLISKAMDLVEQRIEAGTASAQEVTHFLKLGTVREQLERDKIRREIQFMDAKEEQMKSGEASAQIAAEALAAMRRYSGHADEGEVID